MSACVLDSSAALAWVLPGEAVPGSERLLHAVAAEGALAPGLWVFEVANVLLMAERRQRLSFAQRQRALDLLAELAVRLDPAGTALWPAVAALAARHGLTVYDASYLELAVRTALPLATLDRQLRQAALAAGVPLALD